MSKKRERITNPEPFLPLGSDAFSSKKRSKRPKHHQLHQKLVPCAVSSKILKEALLQQKEIQHEEDSDNDVPEQNKFVLPQLHGLKDNDDDEDDVAETHSQFGQFDSEDEIDEEDEKLLDALLSKKDGCRLADIIVEKIKEKDAQVFSGAQPMTQMRPHNLSRLIDVFKRVGKVLSTYTSGSMSKPFKRIPKLDCWEQLLNLTKPENWSPNAMYKATLIFSTNMSDEKVARFYKLVLLPRVRQDIRKNKKLHFALRESLKKAVFKPAAFNRGILFPLWESRTCTKKETSIFLSIIAKISFPVLHASVALLKLAKMEHFASKSYFIISLIEKKYALPYKVLDALVAYFMKFNDDSSRMHVIWHQSLLAFAQRYKNELTKEDKTNLKNLVKRHRHHSITPDILRELDGSRNRGDKEDDLMSISLSVVTKPIEEDRFDIPDVPMEDD